MEQNNLSITTTDTNFVVGDSLYIFDSLSTYRLSKNKHFVLNLEGAEISRSCTSKQEFLIWLGESKACIISDHGTCSDQLIRAMSFIWIKRPKSQLFRSSDSKLIIQCISQFNIFDKATPSDRGNTVREDLWSDLKGGHNLPSGCVPDEQFSI